MADTDTFIFKSTRDLQSKAGVDGVTTSNIGAHKKGIANIELKTLAGFAKKHGLDVKQLIKAQRGGNLKDFIDKERESEDSSSWWHLNTDADTIIKELKAKIAKRVKENRSILGPTFSKQNPSGELAEVEDRIAVIKKARQKKNKKRKEVLKDRGIFKTEILQYPNTVAARGGTRDGINATTGSGHYIIFYINASAGPQADSAALVKAEGERGKLLAKVNKNRGGKPQNTIGLFTNSSNDTAGVKFGVAGANQQRTHNELIGSDAAINSGQFANASSSLYGEFVKNSIRLGTAIALYMPNQVQATYKLNYADDEAGALSTGLAEVFRGMSGGDTSLTGGQFTRMAQGATLKALETAAPGATNALSVATGKILNNKMELAFKGIGRRTFNFTFTFTPHSREEAKIIDTIVARFKFHSHPEFLSKSKGLMMTIPDTFDMHYMYKGAENSFLNKISTCFLTAINVQYGGDRYTAHDTALNHQNISGSPPTKTILTMEFQELETITRERISEGY